MHLPLLYYGNGMRTRMFGGEVYIKATELARQYHYTADYLGQLARQEKVKARLAGRSWYIEEASLLEYRKRSIVRAEPQPTALTVKSPKTAKKPAPAREVIKRRTPATAIVRPPKRGASRLIEAKDSTIAQTAESKVGRTAMPSRSVKAGLWQKASGWLRKLKKE